MLSATKSGCAVLRADWMIEPKDLTPIKGARRLAAKFPTTKMHSTSSSAAAWRIKLERPPFWGWTGRMVEVVVIRRGKRRLVAANYQAASARYVQSSGTRDQPV